MALTARAALMLWTVTTALAQGPAVASVVRAADFGNGIPPDDFGTVYGINLSDKTYQASAPWPTKLGVTEVLGCGPSGIPSATSTPTLCQTFQIFYASPTQINFYIPSTAPSPGIHPYLWVRVNGVVAGGLPYTGILDGDPLAPAIFIEGYDCIIDPSYAGANQNCGLSWTPPPANQTAVIRGAVTDLKGNLLTSSNPAHLNDYVSIWATGLSPLGTTSFVSMAINNAPLCCGGKYTSIGPYPVSVAYAGESPIFPGLFQINVKIPATLKCGDPVWGLPAWPSGNYSWDLNIQIGVLTAGSNTVWVPIVVRPGDVSCSN